MDGLKAMLDKYGKDLNAWLTSDQRNELLNILRDSFLCDVSNDECQQRKDLLLVIELLAGSFQLNGAARQFHYVSQ